MDYNQIIQQKKAFRNPSIYSKLIDFCSIDELGDFPMRWTAGLFIILNTRSRYKFPTRTLRWSFVRTRILLRGACEGSEGGHGQEGDHGQEVSRGEEEDRRQPAKRQQQQQSSSSEI